MTPFADRLQHSIERRQSYLCAGLDPQFEAFPSFMLERASSFASAEERVCSLLSQYFEIALDALEGCVSAVKPNSAFFEQYGLGGVRALDAVCRMARARDLPVIADAKRGDIGSTAAAYSAAFLGQAAIPSSDGSLNKVSTWDADALTVNPYLGFDTIEPFLTDCVARGKGIYVLVRTSNPGGDALQGLSAPSGARACETVADWLAAQAPRLAGACGFSGVGAVVGATRPEEAARMRERMPNNLLLIPGLGAQGGSASDAAAGFSRRVKTSPWCAGAVVNVSRGLFADVRGAADPAGMREILRTRARSFNEALRAATSH